MVLEKKRAQGALPVGVSGDYLFNDVRTDAAALAQDIGDYLKSPSLENLDVDFSSGEYQICGTVDSLHKDFRVSYRPARIKMKDYLNAWINHVILNVTSPEDYPKKSLLVGEEGAWRFEPLPNAADIMHILIQYYLLGHTKPLKLFARSSWAYASALWQKNKSMEAALDAAQTAWRGDDNGFIKADSEEIACRICFEDINPIDAEFQKTAENILKELFVHMVKAES